jgi:lysophospholipase L1-like esterase
VDTLTLIQSAPISIDPYLGSVSNPVLIVFGGTNDIWLSGKTAAQTYAGFQTYIETRIAAGWNNIIVLTMLPRQSSAPNEATRQAFNTLLRNGAATYGYTVADIGNDPTIGQAGDQTNTTYYAPDQIHLTQAGQLIVAQDILAVL